MKLWKGFMNSGTVSLAHTGKLSGHSLYTFKARYSSCLGYPFDCIVYFSGFSLVDFFDR